MPVCTAPGHWAAITTEHVPSLAQHAKLGETWHGLGVHVTPICQLAIPPQFEYVVLVHAPVLSTQHAPFIGCGHGLGVQLGLVPHWFGTAHWASAPIVHAPVAAQHVPCGGCGQVFVGEQLPPTLHTAPVPHAVWMPNVHAPVWATQQVPIGGCGHGFGVQLPTPPVPCCHVLVVVLHWNWNATLHVPVSVTQHCPPGGIGHGFGEHTFPLVHTLGLEQLAAIVTEHPPTCVQQLPLAGSGQTCVVHCAPFVHTELAPVHCTCAFVEHVPSAVLQHAPCGGNVHRFGLHVPSCVQLTAWLPHAPCVVTVHVAVKEQHAPFTTHGFGGPHVRPPVHTFVPEHDAWKYTTHPPSCVQHVPVGGHGFVVQLAPAMNVPGNAHDVAAAHIPSVVQHAPCACARSASPPTPNTTAIVSATITTTRRHAQATRLMGPHNIQKGY
jgi:hypothetical protein